MKTPELRALLQGLSNVGFSDYTIDGLIAYIDTCAGARPTEPPAPSPVYNPRWCSRQRRLCTFSQTVEGFGWQCCAPNINEMLCN